MAPYLATCPSSCEEPQVSGSTLLTGVTDVTSVCHGQRALRFMGDLSIHWQFTSRKKQGRGTLDCGRLPDGCIQPVVAEWVKPAARSFKLAHRIPEFQIMQMRFGALLDKHSHKSVHCFRDTHRCRRGVCQGGLNPQGGRHLCSCEAG